MIWGYHYFRKHPYPLKKTGGWKTFSFPFGAWLVTFFRSDFFNFQHYGKISPSLVDSERSRWNGLHSNLLKSSGRQTNNTNEIHNKNWNFEEETKLKKEDNPSTIPITKGSTSSSHMINGPRKTEKRLHLCTCPKVQWMVWMVWVCERPAKSIKLEKTPNNSACAFAWTISVPCAYGICIIRATRPRWVALPVPILAESVKVGQSGHSQDVRSAAVTLHVISKNLPTPELKISTTTAVTRDQASRILIGIDRKHPTSTLAYAPHILMKCQMAYLMRWHNPGSQLAGSFQVVSKYLSPLHHPAVNSLNQRPQLSHFSNQP